MNKNLLKNMPRIELLVWAASSLLILISFLVIKDKSPMVLLTALVGVAALTFVVRGSIMGQLLLIVFSVLYSVVACGEHYYGEMVTFAFMQIPVSMYTVVKWGKEPYKEHSAAVVEMNPLKLLFTFVAAAIVTLIMFFILKHFNTPQLVVSTLSIAASFIALSLTVLHSPHYSFAFAINDILMIILWVVATVGTHYTPHLCYIPLLICLITFLANDIYGVVEWQNMKLQYKKNSQTDEQAATA